MLKSASSNGSNAARDSYACKSGTIIKSIISNGSNPVRDSVAAGFPAWTIYKCCFIFIKQYAAFRAKGRIAAVNSYVCKSGTILKILFSMEVTLLGIVMLLSPVQLPKAKFPMEITPFGIVTLVRAEQLKKPSLQWK